MKREASAGLEPAPGEREEVGESLAWHVAQPEPSEQGVDLAVRLGPGVAHVQVRAEAMRDEPLARTIEGGS